ncbi:hypothetical protein AURDEDRAFT_187994 [Auricularia subglabra TFB-10046 SS5]|uniref:Uncharacterized protein n=1 Tax=Auricularia subglabra (strain TFB-10046 / SS5) TaxID=717982 RepID=J0D0G3_AURST|nr:hypothetical protein AURDEDRAFT_187994 [Auricularia subglabra TFB-10046 SS5]
MAAGEQTVSALLRGLVLPRCALAGPASTSTTPPATGELRLVQPLDDFATLVSQHTARLPPVMCPSPAVATDAKDDGFRAAVLHPVRVSAGVLAAVGLLDAAQAMVNAEPGQLLYCEGAKQRPRMLVLVSPLATLSQTEVSPLSSQIAELCRKCRVRHFAVTDYAQWIFGCLSDGYGSAWLSPPIANDSTQPTAVEALCYWMAQSHSVPTEEASPPAEAASIEDAVPPVALLRRPSSSAAVRAPDPDENAKPRTSPRKRKADEPDAGPSAPSPKKRKEQDGDPAPASPSKKRRSAEEQEGDGEAPLPATPTPSPKKRRVADNDFPAPGPATPVPARRGPSPSKVPLPESPSPRKRSPRKAAAALPAQDEPQPSTSTSTSTAASTLAAPERPGAFITPPTSARPTQPPAAPAPFSSPVRPPTGSRESPSPRRRGRKAAGGDEDVLFFASPEKPAASPRKRKAGAEDDAAEGSPRKRRTAAALVEDAAPGPMLGEGSPRKRRAAASGPAAAAADEVTGSPRKRRTRAA